MSDQEPVPSLPSTEDTKLGNILKELTPELQDVKDAVLHISNKYRSDLTSQLDQSLNFEQHLSKNFARLSRKSKRLYQSSEDLNTSLNKKLDQLKPFDELETLTKDITDSVFGILDSLNQVEMILPYNQRLGVQDSPHRAHYPNLYRLLNPVEDESTIQEDEIEGFEQLSVHDLQEFDGDVEDSVEELEELISDAVEEDDQEDDQEEVENQRGQNEESEEIGNSDQELTDINKTVDEGNEDEEESQQLENNEDSANDATEMYDVTNGPIHETEFQDDEEEKNSPEDAEEEDKQVAKSATDHHEIDTNGNIDANKSINKEKIPNESDPQTDEAKRQELESVIDNYKSTRSLKTSRSQSIRSSFRPISAAISIPSTSSAGITNVTASTSTSSGSDQARGTLVGSSSSNGQSSLLTDILKKYMKS